MPCRHGPRWASPAQRPRAVSHRGFHSRAWDCPRRLPAQENHPLWGQPWTKGLPQGAWTCQRGAFSRAVRSSQGRKGSWQQGPWPGRYSEFGWGLRADLGAAGHPLGRNLSPG